MMINHPNARYHLRYPISRQIQLIFEIGTATGKSSTLLRQSLWNVSMDLYSVSYNSPPSTFVDGEVASLCMTSAYIHIPCIPICNDCNDLWSFLAFYGYFMDLYGYLNFNLFECGIPKCQADRGKTVLASHLGLSAWVGWGKHVSWVAWGFVFCFGLALGLWVFVWFRNWCHVDTSWKRCSNQSCTFKRVCLYLESISIPYQVLEFYIQKIVDTVSWVTQQLRYQYHLNWSI